MRMTCNIIWIRTNEQTKNIHNCPTNRLFIPLGHWQLLKLQNILLFFCYRFDCICIFRLCAEQRQTDFDNVLIYKMVKCIYKMNMQCTFNSLESIKICRYFVLYSISVILYCLSKKPSFPIYVRFLFKLVSANAVRAIRGRTCKFCIGHCNLL